ncbi:MAG: pfkB carbohydrate kinase family protein [Gammaproteobacteria bacterium]|jgi:sugar/nucleoside kinase (ribokinase family)|nr:pfkB carbohydrate kinase family protein [Gammaproteobacteria bacterium]
MKKVLVIGGATLDTIISYEDMETLVHQRKDSQQSYLLLEEGKKIEVVEQQAFSGGGATNAAVSFKRQGYEAALVCKLGRDAAGQMVLDELKNYGIDVGLVSYTDKMGTAGSFVVPSLKGDRTVFAYRGANANLLPENIPLDKVCDSRFVYVTSLSRASAERLPEIAKQAKAHGVAMAVNPGISQLKLGSSFLKSALSGIDTLILNYDEAKQFMVSLMQEDASLRESVEAANKQAEGVDRLLAAKVSLQDSYFNLRKFFEEVLNLGPSVVVVTNGAEGVYVATPERLYFHKSMPVKVVNTLGAGDAFGSSFVGALYGGNSVPDSIRYGIVNSASVIQYPDAKTGLLTQEALKQAVSKLDRSLLSEMNWSS